MSIDIIYDEYEQLRDLLLMSPGTDCLDSIVMDELIETLKNNGVKYPPFQSGQTCYYICREDPSPEDPEPLFKVESSIVKQLTFNEFGTWVVLLDFNIENCYTYGRDIFNTYAMAQLHCDKLNARLNPQS